MSKWRIERDRLLYYIHDHPGCSKTDILCDLDMRERVWNDYRGRVMNWFIEFQRSSTKKRKRGWYTTARFVEEMIPEINRREWWGDQNKITNMLLMAAEQGDEARMLKLAEDFREHLKRDPAKFTPSRPSRMELLMEDQETL